jgi:ferredoxin
MQLSTTRDEAAIVPLLERCSVSPKRLGRPYPNSDEIDLILQAAFRAPDRSGLHPSLPPLRFRYADAHAQHECLWLGPSCVSKSTHWSTVSATAGQWWPQAFEHESGDDKWNSAGLNATQGCPRRRARPRRSIGSSGGHAGARGRQWSRPSTAALKRTIQAMNSVDSTDPAESPGRPQKLRRLGRLPDIDTQRCTGCGQCVAACDPHLLSLEVVRWKKFSVLHEPERCTGCSLCAVKCPFDAITMRK